ncbi:MAG TPA: VanZ family protein [Micromonosporaceae bacterium]
MTGTPPTFDHAEVASVWQRWGIVVLVSVVLVPAVVGFAVWLAARRRDRGVPPGWARRSAFADVFLVAGELPWLWMTLSPSPGDPRQVYLVPLRYDLAAQLAQGATYAIVQIGGNLLVLAAFGAFLPVRFPVRLPTVIVGAALASSAIESMQYLLNLGRVSSVDDVLVNTAGAAIAALCSRPWWRARPDGTRSWRPRNRRRTAAAPDSVRGVPPKPPATDTSR